MGLFNWLSGLGRKKAGKPTPPRAETEMEAIRRREARAAEVRKRIGRSVHPPGEVSGEELFGGRPATGPTRITGKRGHGYRTKHGYLAHVDAEFDPDENAAFLLGIKVPCRSSWVDAARWNEETSTLTLTIHGKDYDFPADFEIASVFAVYGSKGKWFWEQWKGRSGAGEFPLLDQMPLPRRR